MCLFFDLPCCPSIVLMVVSLVRLRRSFFLFLFGYHVEIVTWRIKMNDDLEDDVDFFG